MIMCNNLPVSLVEHNCFNVFQGCIPVGLGERLNGIQEVSGSIPLISTKSPEIKRFQDFFFVPGQAKICLVFFLCQIDTGQKWIHWSRIKGI